MATKHDKPKVGEEPVRQDAPPRPMALDLNPDYTSAVNAEMKIRVAIAMMVIDEPIDNDNCVAPTHRNATPQDEPLIF